MEESTISPELITAAETFEMIAVALTHQIYNFFFMLNTYGQAPHLSEDLAKLSGFPITMDDSLRRNDFGNHPNLMPTPYHRLSLTIELAQIFVVAYSCRRRKPIDYLCTHKDPFDLQDLG